MCWMGHDPRGLLEQRQKSKGEGREGNSAGQEVGPALSGKGGGGMTPQNVSGLPLTGGGQTFRGSCAGNGEACASGGGLLFVPGRQRLLAAKPCRRLAPADAPFLSCIPLAAGAHALSALKKHLH